jgi:uncharacterized protein YwgA
MTKIERISEIIAFILRLMGGRAYSKTKLVKLLYLLDVMYARNGEPNFSGIEYKSYYYGPYSDDIDESLEFLDDHGYITISQNMGEEGNMYYAFELHDTPEFGGLSGREKSQIQRLLSPLVNRSLDELLDITYSTKEYQRTDFREVIAL